MQIRNVTTLINTVIFRQLLKIKLLYINSKILERSYIMAYGIYFKVALKKVLTRNGTKIEYAIPRTAKTGPIEVLTKDAVFNGEHNAMFGRLCDKAKIVTFAENSFMKKLGIDQALLGYDKMSGAKTLSFWQEGQVVKAEVIKGKETVNNIKNYLKVIRDLIDSRYKIPS